MTDERAREVLGLMLAGIDPLTGEILPDDHMCRYSEVTEVLKAAVAALGGAHSDEAFPVNKKNGKLNAGRPWSAQDNEILEHLYVSGATVEEMCAQLQRRERGLKRQLAHLGLTAPALQNGIPLNAGRRWTAADENMVASHYTSGKSVAEIAAQMQRSEYAIICRLRKLGLISADE